MRIHLFNDYRGKASKEQIIPAGLREVSDDLGTYLVSNGFARREASALKEIHQAIDEVQSLLPTVPADHLDNTPLTEIIDETTGETMQAKLAREAEEKREVVPTVIVKIAPSDETEHAAPPAPTDDYDAKTRPELVALGKERGLDVRESMPKTDLIAALRK